MNNNYDFFFMLNVIANVLQIQSYEMLKQDTTNNEIIEKLKNQDNKYLETIVKQNEEIINLLKER